VRTRVVVAGIIIDERIRLESSRVLPKRLNDLDVAADAVRIGTLAG